MPSTPVVSIITPTYQHARYIEECLASAAAQTFREWELIVVDDGSSDETVVRASRTGDDRIRVLSREHVGMERLAETYNAGVAECRGQYLAVLEGDDRWPADRLAFQLATFHGPSIVLSYGRYAVFGAGGQVLRAPPLTAPVRNASFDALGPMLLDSLVDPMVAMIRLDALRAIGEFRQLPGHPHVDYATFLALAQRGQFYAADRVVTEWRRHSGMATVVAVRAPTNFDGPRLCRDLALEVRRRERRPGLPDERAIRTSWSRVLARRYWNSGRVLQAQREWAPARRLFLRGLGTGSASLRQRVLLAAGAIMTVFHLDIERVVALARGGSPLNEL